MGREPTSAKAYSKRTVKIRYALYPVKRERPEVHGLYETVGKGRGLLFEAVACILVGEAYTYYRTIHRGGMGQFQSDRMCFSTLRTR